MAEQLIRKNGIEVFPWVNLSDIVDSKTGVLLTTILERCNHIYLDYKISSGETKLLIPSQLRHQGLWVSYQGYSGALVTEWYNVTDYSDDEWKKAENWVSYTKAIETALAAAETADEATENLTTAINTAAEAAESAEKAAEQAAQAVSDANTAEETANNIVSTLNTSIASANETIASLASSVGTATTSLSSVNTAISNAEESIESLNESITNANEKISETESTIESATTLNSTLTSTVSTAESTISTIESTITSAEETVANLNTAAEEATEATETLGTVLNDWIFNLCSALYDEELTEAEKNVLLSGLSYSDYAWLEWDADYTCTGYTSDDAPTTLSTWKGTSGSTALTDLTRLWAVNMSAGTSMYCAFRYQTALEELDLRGLDTSSVTNMQSTFNSCSSLTSLDVSSWDTSSVTNMQYTFDNCSSLTSLDVSSWDTSSVTNMQSTFYNCSSLTSLDVSSWDTSSVTTLYGTFNSCSSLTSLDVSSWDTSSVTTVVSAFAYLKGATYIKLPESCFESCTDFSNIFNSCTSLVYILGAIDMRSCMTTGSYFESNDTKLQYVIYLNIGMQEEFTSISFTADSVWGLDEDIETGDDDYGTINGLDSLQETFAGLYDRASNGYTTTFTIALNSATYARLSDEELADAVEKGYTVTG